MLYPLINSTLCVGVKLLSTFISPYSPNPQRVVPISSPKCPSLLAEIVAIFTRVSSSSTALVPVSIKYLISAWTFFISFFNKTGSYPLFKYFAVPFISDCVSTVANVVPSPTASTVFLAAFCIKSTPIPYGVDVTNTESATVTPSFVALVSSVFFLIRI